MYHQNPSTRRQILTLCALIGPAQPCLSPAGPEGWVWTKTYLVRRGTTWARPLAENAVTDGSHSGGVLGRPTFWWDLGEVHEAGQRGRPCGLCIISKGGGVRMQTGNGDGGNSQRTDRCAPISWDSRTASTQHPPTGLCRGKDGKKEQPVVAFRSEARRPHVSGCHELPSASCVCLVLVQHLFLAYARP